MQIKTRQSSFKIFALVLVFLISLIFILGLLGCPTRPIPKVAPKPVSKGLPKTATPPITLSDTENRPFNFNPDEAYEITLAKADPQSGDYWMSSFKRNKNTWEIASPPSDLLIYDRLADDGFLNHLLDAFRGIEIQSKAPNGHLESFELSPPRFSVQWKTPFKSYEFRLGSLMNQSHYFSIDGKTVLIGKGSAFKMLNLIESFEGLRKLKWSQFTSDDADEIEIGPANTPKHYAQREGDHWTDRKHKPLPHPIAALLTTLTSAKALRIIDHPNEIRSLKKKSRVLSQYEVKLTDRRKRQAHYQLLRDSNGILYGLNSTRPSALFVLESQLLHSFKTF